MRCLIHSLLSMNSLIGYNSCFPYQLWWTPTSFTTLRTLSTGLEIALSYSLSFMYWGTLFTFLELNQPHKTLTILPFLSTTSLHYARFAHHCRHHHCRICENRQWCTFTAGYELENEKMIGARLKPAVKHHITASLWLEPAVFWRPLITAGLRQEPTVIVLYHCRF